MIFVSSLESACLFLLNGRWSEGIHFPTQFFLPLVRGDNNPYFAIKGAYINIFILAAFFYGGYGVIMIPALGIVDAYGGYTPEYHNALGFFVLCKHYALG